jgi:glycosyltransferase involved in cell wall biosynthesis
MVVLSQDMLSYEPGIMRHFGFSIARLRLLIILILQNCAFKRSAGVIFLTRYSGKIIQKSCGPLPSVAYVPHGVDSKFKLEKPLNTWPVSKRESIECIYVSNTELYKHQWVVVEAISILLNKGYKLKLKLVGGGKGPAQKMLKNAVSKYDPNGEWVEELTFLPHTLLPELLVKTNLFIFASSCENMPVTLLEGMAMGLPIACSNRGPMPEVLGSGGIYFDPTDSMSIAGAIEKIIQSSELRISIASCANMLSKQYNWNRCADETLKFVVETHKKTVV